jgi:hypothetical protein
LKSYSDKSSLEWKENVEVLSVDVNLFLAPNMNAGVSLVEYLRELDEREAKHEE